MAGILTLDQYLGGPDQVQVEQVFPSTQRSLVYNFGQDITGWTFTSDYQTIVVDTMKFNRTTGAPNFSDSKVIGSFPKQDITGAMAPAEIDAVNGLLQVNLPANLYTGAIIPDARANVPMTIVSLTWQDVSTPPQINTHRWALIQCWEPGVEVGDPTAELGYTPLVLE